MEEEQIHELIKNGSLEQVESFINFLKINESETMCVSLAHTLSRRNYLKYSPIHTAIFAKKNLIIELLVNCGVDVNVKCLGTPSLHLVANVCALPHGLEFGKECLKFFLATPTYDVTAKDDQGSNVLHVACELNLSFAVTEILSHTRSNELVEAKDRLGNRPLHKCCMQDSVSAGELLVSKNVSLSSKTTFGYSPLHIAGMSGSVGMWSLLVNAGADETAVDFMGRTPAALAFLHGWKVDAADKASLVQWTIESTDACKTALLTHPLCRTHYTCPPSETETPNAPPENFKRLSVLLDAEYGALRSSEIEKDLVWIEKSNAATISDVLRVHEWPYVRMLQNKCNYISPDAEVPAGSDNLDGDTTISRNTFLAALHGAGSVCQGVDMVVTGKVRNAFAAVRPPGHHAGPKGLTKGQPGGPDSHGFCLLNNISIGAAYAMNVHRDSIQRVAIVDFDVHNGNGTAETVRWLQPSVEEENLLTPYCFGTLHRPRYKPWYDSNDSKNVIFVSVHGYGPRERGLEHLMPQAAFYPGSGATSLPATSLLEPKEESWDFGEELVVVGKAVKGLNSGMRIH